MVTASTDRQPPEAAARAETASVTPPADCVHCGSPIGRFWRPEDGPFCCRGCRTVYELITGQDLDRYYDLRQGQQPPAAPVRPDGLAWFDALVSVQPETGPWRLTLDLQGVHCAACVWLLEELFRREPGGVDLRINPTLGRVDLVWDPTRGDLRNYIAGVERFGYRFGPAQQAERRSSRALLMRMAVSIAVALNVMMFSISYYLGLGPEEGRLYDFFGWLSLALATISVTVGGQVFFRTAVAGLRRRVAHLDLPISLGMVLAYGGSVYAFFTGGPEAAYFDTLTVFVALMLVGRWAQEHVLERNRNALLGTSGAENFTTRRLENGEVRAVPATSIERGQELWIAPGDVVPTDGVLLRDRCEVSLDWITGESVPIVHEPGDTVPAGAFNSLDRGFAVTATESFATSRLHALLRAPAVRTGENRPSWWHRVSSGYVAAVLGLAAAGFLGWVGRDVGQALQVTVAILVVTCPCALGLATPLAEELVHHALRRRGVLVRTPDFLDRALQVRKILLDKTGTLTLGDLVLTSKSQETIADLPADQRGVLAEMTARSNHPVSRCLFAALAADRKAPASALTVGMNLREEPGRGLSLVQNGDTYRLGRPDAAAGTDTLTVFTRNDEILAAIRCDEHFRDDAPTELARLADLGYELHLLSGDAEAKVQEAGRRLGIDPTNVRGGLGPEAKAAQVRELDAQDTLMVGDGLNDAPSFADAFCAATPAVDRPVVPGRADFYFLGDGIAAIGRTLQAARRLRRVVRDNLVLAILYNTVATGLCFAGWVTPLMAAILMPLSSITVVAVTTARLTGRRAV